MDKILYTIGHSQHEVGYFISMLREYHINYVLDVRSTPYSQYAEDYNRENIRVLLKKVNINYSFMGNRFGARPIDVKLYNENGLLDFEKVRQSEDFKKGVNNVIGGINGGNRVVLMCTEKDPIECHRAILVARAFYDKNVEVQHILADGSLQSHSVLNQRLLDMYFPNRYQLTLFSEEKNDADYLEDAYKLQNQKIGYHLRRDGMLAAMG